MAAYVCAALLHSIKEPGCSINASLAADSVGACHWEPTPAKCKAGVCDRMKRLKFFTSVHAAGHAAVATLRLGPAMRRCTLHMVQTTTR